MEEIWKDIKGYKGLYQISSFGRVKSLGNGKSSQSKLKILTLNTNRLGYKFIMLSNYGRKMFTIHRLVASHFIENSLNKPDVNHIDGNKENNYCSNLEWVTKSENCKHSYDTGLHKKITGKNHHNCKLSDDDIIQIRKSHQNKTCSNRELAVIYNTTPQNISLIVNYKNRKNV